MTRTFHREGCETRLTRRRMRCALAGDGEDVWLIGGGSIYAALLGRCRRASVTRVDSTVSDADTFFPIWTPSLIGKLSGPARPSRKMA